MNIKLDENLPRRLVLIGHEVHTARDEGLLGYRGFAEG
jgi:hypothetical protein